MSHALTAVRLVALKLLILDASFAAFAAVVTPPEASMAEATWGGMKLLHLILGTAGAGSTLWFVDRFDPKVLGATITCGIVCAVGGTPFLAHGYATWFTDIARAPLPTPAENLLAIALGAGGLYIIPAIQNIAKIFRDNPFALFDWIRGRGGPPGGSPPAGGQP